MWGFERILAGADKGGYSHVHFVRGQPALCRFMRRLKIKGTGNKRQGTSSPVPSPRLVAFSHDDGAGQSQQQPNKRPGRSVSVSSSSAGSHQPSAQNQPPVLDSFMSSMSTNSPEVDIFDDNALTSVLSSVFQDPSNAEAQPSEGDALLFEGMQFFFVEDSKLNDNDNNGSPMRRMSIQVSQGSGKRRLSLIGANHRFGDFSTISGQGLTSSAASSGNALYSFLNNNTFAGQGMSPKRRHSGRRFSLQRNTVNGRNDFILKQLGTTQEA